MNINYTTEGYDNGWTVETIDSFLKYKVRCYLELVESGKRVNFNLLEYLGMSGEEYAEWVFHDRIHARITRVWEIPLYDWATVDSK